MLPNDFPPVSTVRGYFYAWRDDGLLDEINQKLVEAARLAEKVLSQSFLSFAVTRYGAIVCGQS
jgi:transposase